MKRKTSKSQSPKQVQRTPSEHVKHKAPSRQGITEWIGKYNLPVTLVLVGLMVLIVFHNFITGTLYYLFKDIGSDSLNQMYPHLVLLSKYLRTEGFPLWSFGQGMGQELLSSSLNDPFSFLLCLLPPNQVAYGFIWMELVKILLTALASFFLFRYWTRNPIVLVTGVLFYSFSGFMIIGGGWTIFSTEMLFFTLTLLGFEQLYRNGSWYLFPLAIALTGILRPFDLFIFGLFLFLYVLFRHFSSDKPALRKLLITFGQLVILGLLGVMISLFLFIPGLQIMLDSPRVAGSAGYFNTLLSRSPFYTENSLYYQTLVMRFFSNDLIGNGSHYRGWYNYLEAPLVYIGILPLFLAPQVFPALTKRKRIVYALFLFVFFFSAFFPFFRYAFWAFAGDYFRIFSLFMGLVLLLYSLKALEDIQHSKGVNLIVLAGTFLVLMGLLQYPWKDADRLIGDQLSAVRLFVLIYALILGLSRWITSRTTFYLLLLFAAFTELAYFNYRTVNERDCLSREEANKKTGYNDYAVDAVSSITTQDKSFFRIHKDYTCNPTIHMSFNDAQVQGYFGTMTYNSFNQMFYIRFLEEMNIITKGNERETRWCRGIVQYPMLLYWASTKYNLRSRPGSDLGYPEEPIGTFGNLKVTRNTHFIPLGFMYHQYVPLSVFRTMPANIKVFTLMKACVVEDADVPIVKGSLPQYDIKDTTSMYMAQDFIRDVDELRKDTLAISSFSENRIEGSIRVDRPGMVFFSIPNDRGWQAEVDQEKIKPLLTNMGFMGLPVKPGEHKIILYYRPTYFTLSLLASLTGILIFVSAAGWSLYRKRLRNMKPPEA